MPALFRWIKECFNYYILGKVAEKLIEKINDDQNQIPQEVKNALLSSIMLNQPKQLIDQINQLPTKPREDLLACIETAEQAPQPALPEQEPLLFYRGFIIKEEDYKIFVDRFYDSPGEDSNHVVLDTTDDKEEEYTDLAMKMFDLYNQLEMWDKFNNLNYTPEVLQWAKSLKRTFSAMLQHVFSIHNQLDIKTSYTQNVILTLITLYDKMFTTVHLGYTSVLKTILLETLDLSNEGMVAGLLAFAHYRPDLVCDDIYPFIDRDSQIYKATDYELLENHIIYGRIYKKYQRFT